MENENKIKKQPLEELRKKLIEAEETLSAIRSGDVDAIVVAGLQGEQVFTLTGAERAYRVLIETMTEGAASLNREGIIIYCNQRLSEMLKTPLEKVIGTPLRQFIRVSDRMVFDSLIEKGAHESGKGEVAFITDDGTVLPVLLSISALQKDNANIYGITVTDLTEQKHIEEELRRHRDNLEKLVKVRTSELETSNQQLQEEIKERKKAEKVLRESEERFRQIAESTKEWIWEINSEGLLTYTNHVVEEILGYKTEEVVGKMHFFDFFPSDKREQKKKEVLEFFAAKKAFIKYVTPNVHKNGSIVLMEISGLPILDSRGDLLGYRGIKVDVTEYRKLEDQLRHAQKMEAVGTLAGGIAHDFNNILNVIMGYGHMVMDKLEADSPSKENMSEVLIAADRAANLTKRLLVFSRKQAVDVHPININELIHGLQKMLVRIIRESIDFKLDLTDRPLMVLADAGHIEQVLINLAANARDAMLEGGRLTIGTGIQKLDDDYVAAYGYGKSGTYVLITVADTGQGMDAETQKKIFEPFFTTKGIGEGTGLGLAISYGIIKQHNGYIKVYSEIGKGTTFKIWLPVIEAAAEKKMEAEALSYPKGGTETILVAEDDASLRKLSRIVLESSGYTVITAEDGEGAITKFMENRERINLVMLDMIMPKKNGKEVGETIRKVSPRTKILFASGYTMDIIKTRELTESGFDFLLKPVVPRDLLKKVREILDR